MAANGDRIIEIIIETADHTSAGLKKAGDALLAFDRRVQKTQASIRRMTDRAFTVTMRLVDRVTEPGGKINQFLHRMVNRAHRVTLDLNDRITSRIRTTEAKLFQMTAKAYTVTVNLKDNVTKGVKGIMNNALSSLTGFSGSMLAGAGVGYGVYDTVNTYKNFEQQMSTVAAITGAKDKAAVGADGNALINPKTGEAMTQYDQLIAKAKEMGATTQFTASEAGKAFEYMGMAGWDAATMIQAINPVLNLASASGEQLATVSDIVTDAMTAMHIDATTANVEHFSDVLAATATSANTNVAMMGEAFKYAAPLAGNLGYSIDDVSLALGLMANSGIKATQAGTSLRSIFTRLASEPKAAGTAMDILGIKLTEVGENGEETMKSFRQLMKEMRSSFKTADSEHILDFADRLTGMKGIKDKDKLAGMLDKMKANGGQLSETDKIKFSSMLAGQEAMSGLLAILTASDADFEKLAGSIDDSKGKAEEMAKIRMDNLAGDITTLGSAWEGLQLTLMEGAPAQGLRDFTQFVTTEIQKLNQLFQDGIDITDFGVIIGDTLKALKDKFIAFDGVGSILAGGVLVSGLMKIINLVKRAKTAVSSIANMSVGGALPMATPTTIAKEAMSANSMVVHANTVTVNGKAIAGGAGATTAGGQILGPNGRPLPQTNSPTTRTPPPTATPASSGGGRFSGLGKIAGKLAMPLMMAMSAYDIYSTKQENDAAQASADGREQEAKEKFREVQRQYHSGKADEKDLLLAESEYESASIESAEVERDNTNRLGATVGGAGGALAGGLVGAKAGAAIGGGVGAFFGGIGAAPGAAIGGAIGGIGGAIAGSEFGQAIGGSLSDIKDNATEIWTSLKTGASEALDAVTGKFAEIGNIVGEKLLPIKDAAITATNFIVGAAALIGGGIAEAVSPIVGWFDENIWTPITETASSTWEGLKNAVAGVADSMSEVWGDVANWFDANVWQPITNLAVATWENIQNAARAVWETITAYFAPAASWFDSTVWQPITSGVTSVQNAITGAFEMAWSMVTNLWGSVGSWFESNVIAPVKAAFAKITSIGESITGLHTSGNEAPHATGGVFVTPHQGLVAEAGPEAIIPLSPSMRGRAMDLFGKVGSYLGADDAIDYVPSSDFSAQNDENAAPVLALNGNSGGATINVDIGGFSPSIQVSGSGNDANAIMDTIRENFEKLADDIAGHIAEKTSDIWNNQPLTA